MTRLLGVLAVLLLIPAYLGFAQPVRAQATIEASSVQNGYPKTITFKVTASAPSEITDVTLAYSITGRNTSALGKPADVTPAKNLSSEVVVQVNSGSSYIPVGSEFTYRWRITTADGQVTEGPEQKYFYLPTGADWKSVRGDFMHVYYHGDKENLANAYLKAGQDTYQKIGKDLLATELKQVPVKVILFDNEAEMAPSRPGTGGSFDAAVTTCGTKVTNDIVLVIPVACGSPDRTDTLRHEFGHILNQTAGEGPLGKLPSWLDEGTAVLAQSTPGNNYTGAFDAAARTNKLIPFVQMGTPSSDANQVNLFYGQSYAMAKFLVDKSGPAKYAELFATIKKGSRFDQALQQVYGFDMAGFEKEFLAASGSQAQPTATPTARPRQTTATAVPTARNQGSTTQTANDDDGGINTPVVAIIGASFAFALIAVFFYLLSQKLAADRRAAAGANQPPRPGEWSKPSDEEERGP